MTSGMEQVALLQMPWGVLDRGTLSLSIIKRILENKGISAKVHYLNLRFTKYINPDVNDLLIYSLFQIGDWLFGQRLFRELPADPQKMGLPSLIEGLTSKGRAFGPLVKQLNFRRDELENIMNVSIPAFIDECIDSILWENIRIAGFSCKIGSQLSSLLLARKLKERFPHLKIVLGGPNVFGKMGEETIKCFDWIDYVIDGECDNTVARLFGNIIEGRFYENIPGILMRNGSTIITNNPVDLTEDLDSLPIPDYSDYFEELSNCGLTGKVRKIVIPYESTRGCWWGEKNPCSFCAVNSGNPKYRSKSPDRVMEEILVQLVKYHVKSFYAADSIFNMDFFNNLLPKLSTMELGIEIYHDIKPCMTKKQLALLRKAGFKTVLTGIESLDDKLLELMRKGITALQSIQLLKFCSEVELFVSWNFLYGIPGEDPNCYRHIVDIIPSISHLQPPGCVVSISLDRFSPYHCEPEKYGIRNVKPSILYEYIYPDSKVNLDNIAYTFEYDYENSNVNIRQYIKSLNDMIAKWQKVFYEKRSKCEYTITEDTIEIIDIRPDFSKDTAEIARKYTYNGIRRDIYIYCAEIRSFAEICEYWEKCENENKDELRNILDGFLEEKLMMVDNSQYLSLATERNEQASLDGISI